MIGINKGTSSSGKRLSTISAESGSFGLILSAGICFSSRSLALTCSGCAKNTVRAMKLYRRSDCQLNRDHGCTVYEIYSVLMSCNAAVTAANSLHGLLALASDDMLARFSLEGCPIQRGALG